MAQTNSNSFKYILFIVNLLGHDFDEKDRSKGKIKSKFRISFVIINIIIFVCLSAYTLVYSIDNLVISIPAGSYMCTSLMGLIRNAYVINHKKGIMNLTHTLQSLTEKGLYRLYKGIYVNLNFEDNCLFIQRNIKIFS